MTSSIMIPLLSIVNIWSRGGLTALIFAIRRRIHQEDFTTRTWSLYLATSATCWENLRSRDKLLPFPEYNIGQKSAAKGGKMKHSPFYHIPYPISWFLSGKTKRSIEENSQTWPKILFGPQKFIQGRDISHISLIGFWFSHWIRALHYQHYFKNYARATH